MYTTKMVKATDLQAGMIIVERANMNMEIYRTQPVVEGKPQNYELSTIDEAKDFIVVSRLEVLSVKHNPDAKKVMLEYRMKMSDKQDFSVIKDDADVAVEVEITEKVDAPKPKTPKKASVKKAE